MQIIADIAALATPERAAKSQRFFKTGPGQYGEGDVFVGVSMPQMRDLIKDHLKLSLPDLQVLLNSKIHEHRMCALLVVVHQYKKTKSPEILAFYLENTENINNWDLVDCSAHEIVGPNIANNYALIDDLLQTKHLWSERIAMVSTWHTNRKKNIAPTLYTAAKLLGHKHDLMHKAVGWMLREAYKHQPEAIEDFLYEHATAIAPTAMRYACEKMSADKRQYFYGLRRG
jgi:3-methyladenine DNA glycosylase AlkD